MEVSHHCVLSGQARKHLVGWGPRPTRQCDVWTPWAIHFLSLGHCRPPLHICFLRMVLGSVFSLLGSHIGPLANTHAAWRSPANSCSEVPYVSVKQPQQKWPRSSPAAVSPVRTGRYSPSCVNSVQGKGQTSVPAPSKNHTSATLVPSSEWGHPAFLLILMPGKLRCRKRTQSLPRPPGVSVWNPVSWVPPMACPHS